MRIEEGQIPESHRPALIEGKRERVGWRYRMHRRKAEEISLDRDGVIAAHPTIGGEGKRRIEIGAVFSDALVQGSYEIVIAPSAYAGLPIGRDVHRIDGSEWQFERQSAGKKLSTRRIMAGCTIRSASEILSTRHQRGR